MGFRNNICAAIDEITGKTVFTQEIITNEESWRMPWFWRTIETSKPRVWEYRPLIAGTLRVIAKRVELLPSNVANIENPAEALSITSQEAESLIYIIAAAIQNNCKEPSKTLVKEIENSFSAQDIADGMLLVYKACNLPSFLSAINIIKGTEKILAPKEDHD